LMGEHPETVSPVARRLIKLTPVTFCLLKC
jgi:hypothetical protein